jgi:hypothetical protein
MLFSAFALYVDEDTVQEEVLFCRPLKERSTQTDIFIVTDASFNKTKIVWSRCKGISSDAVS